MATPFLDAPILGVYVFINAPKCRTRREATAHYLRTKAVAEKEPRLDETDKALHEIFDPLSMGGIVNRRIVSQQDQRVRIPKHLDLVKANTTAPVPHAYEHYKSDEFEPLVMEKMPGTTLENAWPTLSTAERESIADQVVDFLGELGNLQSPASIGKNPQIAANVRERSAVLEGQPIVFTHGDLDWSNIMVADKRVCGIVDWEVSGYFPPYWEWIPVKRFAEGLPKGSWFGLLEERLAKSKVPAWDGMWEVEKLYSAIKLYCGWALTPEDREENRKIGWDQVTQILGSNAGIPPLIKYAHSRMQESA
ncbi:kinase-like domain-containing protein [Phialemonium atrogriseum]|uniref:Kinase-like domain-containing protein n=1 Tax=Phialemonium atrogriseum TaxID=1093897 RepID=A0AAJ0C8W1_9PEZI|nr:kinase-like domain-containing protein [Phialemonium atrogriseum]KAK1772126.1 kinase-like domain-containing protein [Phialemonium atrogriseum]